MDKLITIRIDEEKHLYYKKLLEKNGMDLSKRVRNFIEDDIKKLEKIVKNEN